MKIFVPEATTQTILLTPRQLASIYIMYVYNEDTRVEQSFDSENFKLQVTIVDTVSLSLDLKYANLPISVAPKNNETFRLKLIDKSTNEILWRGKAFATSQVTQNYKINV